METLDYRWRETCFHRNMSYTEMGKEWADKKKYICNFWLCSFFVRASLPLRGYQSFKEKSKISKISTDRGFDCNCEESAAFNWTRGDLFWKCRWDHKLNLIHKNILCCLHFGLKITGAKPTSFFFFFAFLFCLRTLVYEYKDFKLLRETVYTQLNRNNVSAKTAVVNARINEQVCNKRCSLSRIRKTRRKKFIKTLVRKPAFLSSVNTNMKERREWRRKKTAWK
jgi:hypothetical protein